MKTKLLITLLFVGLTAGGLVGLAQNKPADEKVQKLFNQPGAADKPAATPAEPAAPPEAEAAGEVLPVVQFEDAALDVIFDPKVTALGPDGKSPFPNVSIRLENVTAQNVLEAVLNNNGLQLEKDPKTKISRIAIKTAGALEPLTSKLYQ